jgi:signal transduction histidine kinase
MTAWPRRRLFQRLSIRNKLLTMVLLPLLVVLPLLGLFLLWWGNTAFDRMLITKVQADLAVAQGYFERVLGTVGAGTAAIADSHALHLALARDTDIGIAPLLHDFKTREGMDFINLRGPDGALLFTDSGPVAAGDQRSANVLRIARGENLTSVEVLQPEQLALLNPDLQSHTVVPLVATPNAAPTNRTQEERAMVLLSTHAILATDGTLLGHVQGGVLLNHNLPFIDHINEIVYPEGSLPFGSEGTATLFLEDVRISTNVRLFGNTGHRAIGTRVSQKVRDTVLGHGQTWLDSAFVVNDWYVSAYQPVSDHTGQRVGMLYVGYLERPFTALKYRALASIGVIFFAVMIGAAFVSLRWARSIFQPLEQMAHTMESVEAGTPKARVGAVESGDEIGQLAGHLDHLLDVIDEKTDALQRWNAELDAKVKERTRELENAQAQLLRSEKLAAVGQLTASIAHEVNNPIAVIQGNLDLVRDLIGAEAVAKVRPELRLLDEQIERMRLIVTQLLQFARPNEFAGYVESVSPTRTISDCLLLVDHMMAKSDIHVKTELHSARNAGINRQELQQVLVNLLVNAIHAMPDGGTLTLGTCDWGDDGVEISVADTGSGLEPEVMADLFRPFVTRKKDGTGLGLWISRNIVERYGGDIRAQNRPDAQPGAVFSVLLKSHY